MINTQFRLTAIIALALFSLMGSGLATAATTTTNKPLLNKNKFSIGAGLSVNSVDAPFNVDDETGFQFFAAYDLSAVNLMEGVSTSIELGYMDYGFDGVDNDGLWATAVVDGKISGQFGWLARLGLDFGDDSGIMLGAGVSLALSNRFDTRLEYVVRDDIDSIQLNFIYSM